MPADTLDLKKETIVLNKMKYIIVIASLMIFFGSNVKAEYWYGVDDTIQLTVDSSKVLIMFESGIGSNDLDTVIESIDRIDTTLVDELTPNHFVVCSLTTGVGYDSFLDSLDDVSSIELVEPYYLNSNGQPMLVGKGICVAFNEELSEQEITNLAQANGLTVDREIIGLPNVYVLFNSSSSGSRCVELANNLHNDSTTRYAQPDFSVSISTNSYRLFDYYNQYQQHTKKVIGQFNTASVWDYSGLSDTIIVAVVDVGVTEVVPVCWTVWRLF